MTLERMGISFDNSDTPKCLNVYTCYFIHPAPRQIQCFQIDKTSYAISHISAKLKILSRADGKINTGNTYT